MKYFFILMAMLIIHFSLIRSDSKVIESATFSKHALVVSSQPRKNIKLDPNDMKEYSKNLMEYSGQLLDTTMFAEIIRNSGALDTYVWQDGELKNLLVVQSRDQEISKNYLIEKMNLSGKKQIRYYTRQINRYNETDPSERNIYHFSKPVYSNSGKYAIVQWDNGHSKLSGGGGINLYHLQENKWIEVGVISNWKY